MATSDLDFLLVEYEQKKKRCRIYSTKKKRKNIQKNSET